jgi:hypothetical protein
MPIYHLVVLSKAPKCYISMFTRYESFKFTFLTIMDYNTILNYIIEMAKKKTDLWVYQQ